MQAFLMNFGDNTRVVYDLQNKPMAIDIGQVVEADIDERHYHMIRRAIATDTLMVVPKGTRLTPKMQAVMDILKSIEADPYDDVLAKFNEIAGDVRNEEVPLKPTRHAMLRLLRDLAKYEVAKALQLTSKVNIREEGDAATRQEPDSGMLKPAEDKRVIKEEPPAPPVVKRQKGPAPIKKKAAQSVTKARKRERL